MSVHLLSSLSYHYELVKTMPRLFLGETRTLSAAFSVTYELYATEEATGRVRIPLEKTSAFF